MAEQIIAWKPNCCTKAYLTKGSAARHERKCIHNPDNKACPTCGYNSAEEETIYNPHHGGNPGSTDYDIKYFWCDKYEKKIGHPPGEDIPLRRNCEYWIPQGENSILEKQEPAEPCKSCHKADWIDMYGKKVYGCDMSHCVIDQE